MADDKIVIDIELSKTGTRKLRKQLKNSTANIRLISPQTEKQIENSIARPFNKGAGRAKKSLGGLGKSTGIASMGIARLGLSFFKFGIILKSVNFIFNKFSENTQRAADFGLAIEEINTLQARSKRLTDDQIKSLREISSLYGQELVTTSKAYYNTISAGVTDASKSVALLKTASKAAVVGVTDINTATRALLSAVNAYGQENLTAEEAADKLFSTVQLGRTTFPELANNIGDVIPIAAQLGVGIGELGGFFATATRTVGNTAKVSTQLRQVLIKILDPTKEAEDAIAAMNKKLGDQAIQFDAVTLRRKGLVKFLGDLEKAVRRFDDQDKILSQLFGSTRSQLGILSVLGDKYDEFERNTTQVEKSSGVLNDKIEDVNNTWKRQTDILGTTVDNAYAKIVQRIQNKLLPAIASINAAVERSGKAMKDLPDEEVAGTTAKRQERLRRAERSGGRAGIGLSRSEIQELKEYNEEFNKSSQIATVFADTSSDAFFLVNQLAAGNFQVLKDGAINTAGAVTEAMMSVETADLSEKLGKALEEEDKQQKQKAEERNRAHKRALLEAEREYQEARKELARNYALQTDQVPEEETEGKSLEQIKAMTKGITDQMTETGFDNVFDGIVTNGDKALASFQTIAKGFQKTMGQFSTSVKKNILNGAANAMSRGFNAMGAALANGENAFEAGAKAILGSFGETLSQLGQGYILEGTARLFSGDAGAAGLIASGAALSVFGGFLSAKYGGGASAGPSAAGGGAGAQSNQREDAPEFGPEVLEERQPQTTVNIQVQGDILSENATGEKLVDLVNTAFNQQGVVVEQGIA